MWFSFSESSNDLPDNRSQQNGINSAFISMNNSWIDWFVGFIYVTQKKTIWLLYSKLLDYDNQNNDIMPILMAVTLLTQDSTVDNISYTFT